MAVLYTRGTVFDSIVFRGHSVSQHNIQGCSVLDFEELVLV